MSHPFDVEEDERAVTNPQLFELVQAARRDPLRDTDVTLPVIRRQIEAKGKGFRNGVAAGVVLAAAAAVTLWVMSPGSTPASDEIEPVASGEVEATAPAEPPPRVVMPIDENARLSDAVRVTWKGGAPPVALGAWELQLGQGSYEIALAEPRPERLTIHVAGQKLELAHGELTLANQGNAPVVTLINGVAAWVDPDGTRRPLEVETVTARRSPEPAHGAPTETATDLARKAEQLLADGDRRAAIVELRRLVLRHPKSAAARSALLDLGRELGKEGMRDHARCAYEAYLERFPNGQMREDVERSLARLGDGPSCDGLDPG